MDLSALKSRLDKIKEEADTSITSDNSTPTSLSTFLAIYNKAGHECYIKYMEGAIELIKYLSPIDLTSEMPENIDSYPKMPDLFHGYEVNRLASLLDPRENYKEFNHWLEAQNKLSKTIIYLTCKQYITAHK